MTSSEDQTKMIITTPVEGQKVFLMLRRFSDKIVLSVSEEKNGDAEIALSEDECKALIQMLQDYLQSVVTNTVSE